MMIINSKGINRLKRIIAVIITLCIFVFNGCSQLNHGRELQDKNEVQTERQDSSKLDEISVDVKNNTYTYDECGPEPRSTTMYILIDYYELEGECLSSPFLEDREDFFSTINEDYDKRKVQFEEYIKSDLYKEKDVVEGMNSEKHICKEYIERNDKLLYSSIVSISETYGGNWMGGYRSFNYDFQKQENIDLSDVVIDYTVFKKTVIEELNSNPPEIQYVEDYSYYEYLLYNAYYGQDDYEEQVAWTLDKNGLTLYFGTSQIGCEYIYTIPYTSENINPYYMLLSDEEYDSEFYYDNN